MNDTDKDKEEQRPVPRREATTRAIQPIESFGDVNIDGLVKRREALKQILERVLKEGPQSEGFHYGTIPGCGDKKTLYKAGAEIICTAFSLAPEFIIEQIDLPNGHRDYRIISRLTHFPTGAIVGDGVGSCSTLESKYRYRGGGRRCPECKATTIKRSKYPPRDKPKDVPGWYCHAAVGGCGANFAHDAREIVDQSGERVENPDIADTYNTVLKMAKKRAQVDATLTATGASDVLTQDLEDEDHDEQQQPAKGRAMPQRGGGKPAGYASNDEHKATVALREDLDKIRRDDPEAFCYGARVDTDGRVPADVAKDVDLRKFADADLKTALEDAQRYMKENPLSPAPNPISGKVEGGGAADKDQARLIDRFDAVRGKNPAAAMEAIEANTTADLDRFDPGRVPLARLQTIVDRAERLLKPGHDNDQQREPGADAPPTRRAAVRR